MMMVMMTQINESQNEPANGKQNIKQIRPEHECDQPTVWFPAEFGKQLHMFRVRTSDQTIATFAIGTVFYDRPFGLLHRNCAIESHQNKQIRSFTSHNIIYYGSQEITMHHSDK